jgi:hypothetical protein
MEIVMKKRFVVDLGNIEMDQTSVELMESEIQRAALGALAKIDLRGDLITRFPPNWRGIWIDIGRDLPIDDKQIVEFAGR